MSAYPRLELNKNTETWEIWIGPSKNHGVIDVPHEAATLMLEKLQENPEQARSSTKDMTAREAVGFLLSVNEHDVCLDLNKKRELLLIIKKDLVRKDKEIFEKMRTIENLLVSIQQKIL